VLETALGVGGQFVVAGLRGGETAVVVRAQRVGLCARLRLRRGEPLLEVLLRRGELVLELVHAAGRLRERPLQLRAARVGRAEVTLEVRDARGGGGAPLADRRALPGKRPELPLQV